MSFYELIKNFHFDFNNNTNQSKNQIESILSKEKINFKDLLVLLSNDSFDYLLPIAQKARELTIKRFGKTISFYVPLYLSNECTNNCVYCGFNCKTNIQRITLTFEQIENELKKLKELGYDSVLLLTGEHPKKAGVDYIAEAVKLANLYFDFVGLEIYPMSIIDYEKLLKSGADGLTIYQEVYDENLYKKYHLSGKKSDYKWRLDTPERALIAGFKKVGLGYLMGLNNWQYETAMLAYHLDYLRNKYWQNEFTLSFPRINPFENDFKIPFPVSDKQLVFIISVLRLMFEEVGFLLSTRERPELRDKLIEISITQLSAGSKTSPGGYYNNQYSNIKQFEVSDNRSLQDLIEVVKSKGYDPVIKDWDKSFKIREAI